MSFSIVTDSCCDLPKSLTSTYKDFTIENLTFKMDDEIDPQIEGKDFYNRLRKGSTSTTSAVAPGKFAEAFTKNAEEGKDTLYIAFSSGLSGTYQSGVTAKNMIQKNFPDRKIICVDTLAASCGLGRLVDRAVELRDEGKTIDETAQWLENNKLHLSHWYTVTDLNFLARGGRVKASAAWFGTVLNIKPVMNMDDLGRLIPREKVRGRKRSIERLCERMEEMMYDQPENKKIFISHGDCMDEVQILVDMIKKRFGINDFMINYVGPVIGSHTGPGVIALYFFGKDRDDFKS